MLEIHIIGSTNSGKSTIAQLITKTLNSAKIESLILDEFGDIIDIKNEENNFFEKKIAVLSKRYVMGNEILIKMIQIQRDSYANTKLSDKE